MNPYDVLDVDATHSLEQLREALAEAARTAPQSRREIWQNHLRSLASTPEIRFIWRITSRSKGEHHRYDAALSELSGFRGPEPVLPEPEALRDHIRSSLDAPDQRRAVLRELTELPDLPLAKTFKTGLLGWEEG